jgi:uncharacterized repeat protein (TIGR01451 family)
MHGATARLVTFAIIILLSSNLLGPVHSLEEQSSSNTSKESSSLSFGSNSGSNFVIEPGVGTNILVNITNNALISDYANVSIVSSSGWNIVWPRNSDPSIGEDILINSDELVWIQFRVDVPIVENGMPLAGSKHLISVKAISQNEGLESFWNFTIEVTAVSGISIDSHQNFATVEPGEKVLLPISLRNVGNHNANLVIKVQPMLDSGLPVDDTVPDQSFAYNGWSVGTFDLYKIENLAANNSGIVLIEYASPYIFSGEINIRISAYNEFEPLEILTVNQSVSIERTRGVSLDFDENNVCSLISPSNTENPVVCHENLSITNTGNFNDQIEIQVLSNPIWSNVELGSSQITLQEGETSNDIDLSIEILNGTMAGKNGEITIGAFIEEELIVIEKYSISVDSVINWELANKQTTMENENCTMTITFQNTGNYLDGMMVSLDMNVTSNFGLIPPQNSIFDNSENIRYFEARDIQPNEILSFTAYATTPTGFEMNGTARLEVIAHSISDPRVNFSIAEDIEYLGDYYRISEEEDEPSVFSELLSEGLTFIIQNNGILLTIFVVAIGTVLLNRALVKRQEDMKKFRLKSTEKTEEKVEDWTKKFENKSAGVNTEINSRNISAATDILDHHTKESNLKDADLLALGLIDNSSKKTLGEKLMPSNQTKKKTNISSEVINPSQTIGKSTKSDKTTDTDFDLDL